ncbi:MAG: hypothetical protein ABSH08_00965 [Tepidisphaeraceae bacterium]|jgi:hypothetical protein
MHTELENNFSGVEAVNVGARGRSGLCVSSGRIMRRMPDRTATRLGMGEAVCALDSRRIRREGEFLPVDGPPCG